MFWGFSQLLKTVLLKLHSLRRDKNFKATISCFFVVQLIYYEANARCLKSVCADCWAVDYWAITWPNEYSIAVITAFHGIFVSLELQRVTKE